MPVDLNILIGGEAGQGVQSVGAVLARTAVRGGYEVFADQDIESRIRGGHSFSRVRISEKPLEAPRETFGRYLGTEGREPLATWEIQPRDISGLFAEFR
mgnify:CR=1 FL=1